MYELPVYKKKCNKYLKTARKVLTNDKERYKISIRLENRNQRKKDKRDGT